MLYDFSCTRCGYECKFKQNLIRHLKNKTVCPANFSNDGREDLLNKLQKREEGSFQCKDCYQKFKSRQGLTYHMKKQTCLEASTSSGNGTMQQKLEYLEDELNNLKSKLQQDDNTRVQSISNSNNTINNINHGINVQINLNNYGQETLSHITPLFLRECLFECEHGIKKYLDKVHFDKEVPENRNVRIKSIKSKLLEHLINGKWMACDKNAKLDEMIQRGYRELYKNYLEQKHDDPEFKFRKDYIDDFLLKFANREGQKWYFQLRRNMFVSILNETVLLGQD